MDSIESDVWSWPRTHDSIAGIFINLWRNFLSILTRVRSFSFLKGYLEKRRLQTDYARWPIDPKDDKHYFQSLHFCTVIDVIIIGTWWDVDYDVQRKRSVNKRGCRDSRTSPASTSWQRRLYAKYDTIVVEYTWVTVTTFCPYYM